ncbi:unnamed protein product [Prunus brigantina]
MEKVGFVARSCGKKVAPGTKCGSKDFQKWVFAIFI